MKLKSFLLCAVLGTALTTAAFADSRPAADPRTVLNQFAESHLNTDADKLEKILSSDALMRFTKGTEVMSQGQTSILKIMRQNQGIKQNCVTQLDVLASSDAMMIAKVNFVYDGFVIENFLTLEVDKNENWKITRINKFFNEAGSAKVITKR